jgi:hypothetical protein
MVMAVQAAVVVDLVLLVVMVYQVEVLALKATRKTVDQVGLAAVAVLVVPHKALVALD